MVKINLLPDVVLERRRQAKIKRIANLSLVGWAGLVLLVLLLAFGYNQWQSRQLEQTQSERDEVAAEAFSPENVSFRQEALSVQSSLDALVQLQNERQLTTRFLATLSRNMSEDIRITSLGYETDNTINIGGRAPSYQAVGSFESALKNSQPAPDGDQSSNQQNGYFSGVSLSGVNAAGGGEVRFELSAQYTAPSAGETAATSGENTQGAARNSGDGNE